EGNITVVRPNGGESWSAGTPQNLTWTDNINENVTIELYKGGTLHSVIDPSTGSDGLKVWDIPFTLESGNDYSIKITSVNDPSISDVSNANFIILGNQIAVTSPNGGEILLETDDYIITWNDNLTGNVEIQLIKSDVFHSSISTSTPSDGSYTWNPPASTPSGTDYKIKIISVADAAIFDLSDSTFTIISNSITVTSPNGGENWLIGSSNTITWTDDISGEVKIDLYKGGALDTTIAVSVPSSGSFEWDFADAIPGIDYQIRISSVNQPALFDLSDNNFTLFSGDITVNSPNGDESWLAGSSQTIFWDDNIDGDVIIELYKGGVPDSTFSLISGPTASDGTKNWDLPFDIESGDDYQVKITSVENPSIFDFSDANFSIEGFEITITSPNGGEIWYVDQDYNITWTSNLTGSVEIHLFKAGVFQRAITGSTPSDGTRTWSIPAGQETGSDYSIRIASLDNSNIFDFSDTTFTLAHNIIVASPNGGETWQAGSAQTITWSDNLVGNVKLELHKNGAWYSDIVTSAPSTGSYTWDIPADTEADITFKVKVVSAEDTSVYDYSDNDFEIFAGSITVVSPNGGELLQAGSAYSINWTSDISENVKIELYKGGSLHSSIVASTSNDGSYNWTDMPFTIESGSDYQVRIASTSNDNTFDFSDGNFTITGNEITVLAPNGGEVWAIGEPYFIKWDDNINGQIQIFLFKANQLALVIDSGDPSDGSYAWTIPGNVQKGSDYKIQIVSRDNGNINDFSDAEFTIDDQVSVENITNEIPDIYTLYQNYPNPFNPQTKIEFGLPEESTVSLKIYDLTGQQVDVVLDNENLYAGKFRFDFDASYLPSGIYFYILVAKSNTSDLSIKETKKMILMK
ncbi:MAG: Ser-Thr-rich GPI-anchored membrane family protein, partial [Candidatus Kariarchaeaceae archaeon]